MLVLQLLVLIPPDVMSRRCQSCREARKNAAQGAQRGGGGRGGAARGGR